MRIPTRRSQQLKQASDEGADILTAEGLRRLKDELARLEREQPQAIEEVDRTRQFGDFSENAEYQDAKSRLRRLNDRVLTLNARINRAMVIEQNGVSSGRVRLGSKVTVETGGRKVTYEIVGPRESNPSRGRISHLSPLGAALTGHATGDEVTVQSPAGLVTYRITDIR